MEKIKLLDGSIWGKDDLLDKMRDDDFYFNYLSTDRVLSKSSINELVPPNSPKKWYYKMGKKDDSALRAGHLFHLAILEPEKFSQVQFSQYKHRSSKGYKDKQASMTETLYSANEKDFNEKLVGEFTVNKKAMTKLSGATFEEPVIGYIDDIPFRGKIDIVSPDGRLLDLKTCGNLSDFPKNADQYGYDIQCYIYSKLMGVNASSFEFLVISKNTYDIGFFTVDQSFINQGKEKLESAIEIYKSIFLNCSDEEIREKLNEITFQNKLYSRKKFKNV